MNTDMEHAGSERAARLIDERMVLQLHSTPETQLIDVTHDDPVVNPEVIIQESRKC